jgi:hypothetical protein
MRRCVWSRNLVNKGALAQVGELSYQKQTNLQWRRTVVECLSLGQPWPSLPSLLALKIHVGSTRQLLLNTIPHKTAVYEADSYRLCQIKHNILSIEISRSDCLGLINRSVWNRNCNQTLYHHVCNVQIRKQFPQNNSKELWKHLVVHTVAEWILSANHPCFIALQSSRLP